MTKQNQKVSKKGKKKSSSASLLNTPKKKTMFFSGIGAVVVIIASFALSTIPGNSSLRDLGFVGGAIVGIVPLAMLDMKQKRRSDSIDRNLPIFLLTLSSSVQSGQTLLRAIEESADRNMGSLTPELKNLRANISWGMPVEEALENFTRRVGTRLAKRVMVLLQLSMEIGGDVIETLEVIQKHVTEMANLEKDRKSELSPYIFTIYISFAVFLGITVILVSQFFVQIEVMQASLTESIEKAKIKAPSGGGGSGMLEGILDVNVKDIVKTIFHMAIVEAVIGGLAAGKIGESSFVAGVKHIVIMVVIAVIAFYAVGAF
ncbi:MAG: type II secretion system F family protein [Nitrososphaerota archaeon]